MLGVARGWGDAADRALLAAMRFGDPLRADGKPRKITTAARDLMAVGGDMLRLLVLAACIGGLIADGRAATAGWLAAIFAVARGALFLLKKLIRRPRPDIAGHGVVTYTSSFPSGHTFMTVVLYLAAAVLIPGPGAVMQAAVWSALIGSLIVGATRICFGVHWPSDVLTGWVAGIAWASGCLLLL